MWYNAATTTEVLPRCANSRERGKSNWRFDMLPHSTTKTCPQCGIPFGRRVERSNGKLEAIVSWRERTCCSKRCAGEFRRGKPVKDQPGNSALHYRATKLIPKTACQLCGAPDAHDVHHIDQNPANNALDNLLRLCHPCHFKQHAAGRKCAVCDKPHEGNGYCNTHNRNFRLYGSPYPPERRRATCSICGKQSHGRELCGTHYHQWWIAEHGGANV